MTNRHLETGKNRWSVCEEYTGWESATNDSDIEQPEENNEAYIEIQWKMTLLALFTPAFIGVNFDVEALKELVLRVFLQKLDRKN